VLVNAKYALTRNEIRTQNFDSFWTGTQGREDSRIFKEPKFLRPQRFGNLKTLSKKWAPSKRRVNRETPGQKGS